MVRRQQITILSLVLAVATTTLSGCSSLGWQSEQQRQLSQGLQSLQAGDLRQSHLLFEQVANASPVDGVTDEALFRLALLQLVDEGTTKGVPRSQALLERLRKEFPGSPWTTQAVALSGWLKGDREQYNHLLRENRELIRENRELRQNIERLKNLDLEIEKKRKR